MAFCRGIITAIVTPFRGRGIDFESFEGLIRRQVEAGVRAIVVAGTTGEGATLSVDEFRQLLKSAVQTASGDAAIIAGTGTNSTHKTLELSDHATACGAQATMAVCPYYNRPTAAGLEAHFATILERSELPLVVYNVPGRTGVDLPVEVAIGLAGHDKCIAFKEASFSVDRVQRLVQAVGKRTAVLCGDDALSLAALAVGAQGVVSVTANLQPSAMVALAAALQANNLASAQAIHARLLPLHHALFIESNPGPIKAALWRQGIIAPELRLPLTFPDSETLAALDACLAQLNEVP